MGACAHCRVNRQSRMNCQPYLANSNHPQNTAAERHLLAFLREAKPGQPSERRRREGGPDRLRWYVSTPVASTCLVHE
jgi:hypothetical protein